MVQSFYLLAVLLDECIDALPELLALRHLLRMLGLIHGASLEVERLGIGDELLSPRLQFLKGTREPSHCRCHQRGSPCGGFRVPQRGIESAEQLLLFRCFVVSGQAIPSPFGLGHGIIEGLSLFDEPFGLRIDRSGIRPIQQGVICHGHRSKPSVIRTSPAFFALAWLRLAMISSPSWMAATAPRPPRPLL